MPSTFSRTATAVGSTAGLNTVHRLLKRPWESPSSSVVIRSSVHVSVTNILTEVSRKQLAYPASKDPNRPDANIVCSVSSTRDLRLTTRKAFWPVEILQVPALGLVKSSFILLYRRIFTRKSAPRFNMVSLGVLALIISWTVAFFFALVFICGTDFSAYWTSTTVERARCVDTNILHNAFAISDPITDIIVILLPLPMVSLYQSC